MLGIDEFALRRGHVYATSLVDIETRRSVALLPDRTVETVARRLLEEIRQRGFPGQEQIVRVYVRQLREEFPNQDPRCRKPTVRDVTGWITRHPDRPDADAQQLKEILARVPASPAPPSASGHSPS